jgi:hypothetical protein
VDNAQGLQDRIQALEGADQAAEKLAQQLQTRIDALEEGGSDAELRPRIRALEDQVMETSHLQDRVTELQQSFHEFEQEAQREHDHYEELLRLRTAITDRQHEHTARTHIQRSAELQTQHDQESISRNRVGLEEDLRRHQDQPDLGHYERLAKSQSDIITRAIEIGSRRLEAQRSHPGDASFPAIHQSRTRDELARALLEASNAGHQLPPMAIADPD